MPISNNIQITLTPGVLPQGYCYPGDPQQFNSDIVSIISAVIPGNFSTFNFGPNTPPVDQQDVPWLRTDNAGVIEGWYTFQGSWVRPYPVPPSSPERRMWVGAADDLLTYDGGSSDPITDRTGPFWEVDHSMDFKFPLGPGTSGSLTVNVNDTGGNTDVTLGAANVPNHRHVMPLFFSTHVFASVHAPGFPWDDSGGTVALPPSPLARSIQATDLGWSDSFKLYTDYSGDPGGGPPTPVSLLPPYKGTFFIKRTARVLVVAPTSNPPTSTGNVLVGDGPPSPTLGIPGDIYVDRTITTGGLYWKENDGWHP